MAKTLFAGQQLTESTDRQSIGVFEMTFVDSEGNELVLSLPRQIAADSLVPLLTTLSKGEQRNLGQPTYVKSVKTWRVGSSENRQILIVFDDDAPRGLTVDSAKKMWREIREEAEIVSRRPAGTKQ